ncbi:GntR family transcriptional regulator [Brevibacterium sp. UCMA 11754]|uniref:GntR family transcriptional regulator n=1 Tax=Brevibacterium sp. UCMA 11754 TaxID=2749198 RepID=UPI001F19776C|nr:GntR family transcriptional regulator [Brevibacterium sp. UCMA 11754]MCF2571129.1 GntR family transcriptional regulator [Brevibacterium sp. UCMA 11754]
MASLTIDHGATGAHIAEKLREDILAGLYVPGERIRPDEIAEHHGASRVPVREALLKLENEGLVTMIANRGSWVSELNQLECQELYHMREHLEPMLLGLNVPLIKDADIDELQSLANEMEACDDVESFLTMDREFHLSRLRYAPTVVLAETVLSLWNRTQHYRRAVTRLYYTGGDLSLHHDHQLIVGALRRRDEHEATSSLATHIRRSRMELAKHPEVFAEARSSKHTTTRRQ